MPRMDGVELIQRIRTAESQCAHHSALRLCGAAGPHGGEYRRGCGDRQEFERARAPGSLGEAPGQSRHAAQAAGYAERQRLAQTRAIGALKSATLEAWCVPFRSRLHRCAVAPVPRCALRGAARQTGQGRSQAAPLRRSKLRATVRRWMKSMTLRDEVAQLVFIRVPRRSSQLALARVPQVRAPDPRHQSGRPDPGQLRRTAAWCKRPSPTRWPPSSIACSGWRAIPLMVGGDFERGASMRVDGTTVFPHAMAFGATGDPAFSRYEGEVTAREARALGVHWVYYPVADVNNNPDNPIINIRSFGENPQAVAAHVKAFIEGAHADKKNYVLTTAKHFPGHGDTAVDTHLNLATITADRDRLEQPGTGAVQRRHRSRRGFHHDGAHRRARAGAARLAGHAFARDSHRPAAQRTRLQGPGGHRRAGDGRHRQRLQQRAKRRCARSKPAPIRC